MHSELVKESLRLKRITRVIANGGTKSVPIILRLVLKKITFLFIDT